MTAASWLKMRNKNSAAKKNTTLIATVTPAAMARQTRVPRRTRSYCCAPKFCPANVVMAMPSELMVIQKIKSILP